MIGLDTNILVRFVAQDDPFNCQIANAIIDSLTPEEPGWVSLTAAAELIWVIDRRYKMGRHVCYDILNKIMAMPELVIEQEEVVRKPQSYSPSETQTYGLPYSLLRSSSWVQLHLNFR